MKIHVDGATPMERLTNLTKRLMAVPKAEVEQQAKRYDRAKQRRKARRQRSS